ncbi:spermatogenesis-associated protein 19, mitochondrial [Apteryx mantelli]|uniref:Spermatogenesis-associated protein 19, mitochondrial n=1 Tax=Apteryx mantelli TaxID=2696672 RepID=A0ABM4FME8_9AVES
MIISTWLAYILAREGTGTPFPSKSAQDIPVVEMETLSVLEHWLRKIEEEASRIFRQKLEGKSEQKAEDQSAPLVDQDFRETNSEVVLSGGVHGLNAAVSHDIWDLDEPPPAHSYEDEYASDVSSLGPSPSQSFTDDRTKIQFLRWSQTQVCQASSSVRDEAMQERLDKIRSSVSQVMLQATQDSVSDTDVRATLSSEG